MPIQAGNFLGTHVEGLCFVRCTSGMGCKSLKKSFTQCNPFQPSFIILKTGSSVESNSKLNIYTILLLPLLAAAVGGLVLLAMYLLSDPAASGPATHPVSPIQTELALKDAVEYISKLFRLG
jgi:hypothetical protein